MSVKDLSATDPRALIGSGQVGLLTAAHPLGHLVGQMV